MSAPRCECGHGVDVHGSQGCYAGPANGVCPCTEYRPAQQQEAGAWRANAQGDEGLDAGRTQQEAPHCERCGRSLKLIHNCRTSSGWICWPTCLPRSPDSVVFSERAAMSAPNCVCGDMEGEHDACGCLACDCTEYRPAQQQEEASDIIHKYEKLLKAYGWAVWEHERRTHGREDPDAEREEVRAEAALSAFVRPFLTPGSVVSSERATEEELDALECVLAAGVRPIETRVALRSLLAKLTPEQEKAK